MTNSRLLCQTSFRVILLNKEGFFFGVVPGEHLSGVKALAGLFVMSRLTGDFTPGKTHGKRPFAKAFYILSGLLPLAKCNIYCSVLLYDIFFSIYLCVPY
ncbi:transmembrane protein, putative [Medicago truncatula]|uniref:Transmembrane protein, putative n=2 Tax=Medicago truncatula TaxID=3880 RepID=G7KJ05_MEDTR|nr:transmembrane protein, putative [Medicago truncatula]